VRELLSAIEERMTSPTARGLADAVSRAIRDGVLEPGTKLPPIRRVATELALSPTTVSAGWTLLTRAGALHTDGRRGTTVADGTTPGAVRYRTALRRRAPFDLDLSTGVPDAALLPALDRALGRLDTAGTPSSYLDDPVLPELVAVLRDQWPYPAEQLTVVDGAMDALDQVTRTVLRFGDTVVLEHPCFPALADLMEASGIAVRGVPVDEHGLVARGLADALTGPVAAVFLQPRAHNPTGASMTPARARELARVVAGTGALVVEDDSAGAIAGTEPVSLGRWLPERTVHVRSFSKSHGPDLRLAALSAPPDVMQHLQARRQLGQGWSSRLLQRVLHSLLVDPGTVADVEAARVAYAARRHGLVTALAARGVAVPAGDGINLWLPVQDEAAALAVLAGRGIGAAPGAPFMVLPAGPDAGHLRVTCGLVPDAGTEVDRVADALAAAATATGAR
jgi:DNA-binding transcriptional MocR family regulator